MRQPARIACLLRYLVIAAALCFAARAHADDRGDARAHYQAGLRFYSGGDYQGAIREFSAAQQLLPADLNNYNLALCYDKMGDAEPAIQYYCAFLDKQPNTDKRAEIEASISRLEAAQRSAASKKAGEAKRAEGARRAAKPDETVAPPPEAPPVGPVLGPAPPPGAAPAPPAPPAGPVLGPAPPPAPEASASPPKKHRGPAIAGSIGPPSSAAPTGDSQLDRADAINIDEIRDRRAGAGMTGPGDHRGPAVSANEPPPPPGQPGGQPGASAQGDLSPMAPPPVGPDEPKKEDPVYKKWWFWGIIAVTGVVVYELATSPSSSSTNNTGRFAPPKAAAQPGGLTLLRW
jgi:hypothetical protein